MFRGPQKKVKMKNLKEPMLYLFSQYQSQWTGTREHLVHWRSAGTRRRSGAPAPAVGSDSPPHTAAPPHELQDSIHGPGRSAAAGTDPPASP